MRVKRYIYGTTNIDELQSGRRSIRSPAEAARDAAMPFTALTQATQAASRDLLYMHKREKQLQEKEAAQIAKIAGIKLEATYEDIRTNPSYKDQVQPNGDMTAKVMLDDYEKQAKELMDSLAQIEDPKLRQQYTELLETRRDIQRTQVRNLVNARREDWNTKGEYDFLEVLVSANEYEGAYTQLQSMVDEGLLTQEQYRSWQGNVRRDQVNYESDKILDDYNAAYQAGRGEEFYEQLVNDKTLDKDIKDIAIAKVENQQINFEKIESKKTGRMMAGFMGRKTDIRVALERGEAPPEPIEALVGEMMATNNPQIMQASMTMRQELLLASLNGAKGDLKYQTFMAKDGFVLDTKQNREFVDRQIQDAISVDPNMSTEEKQQIAIDIMRTRGVMSQSAYEAFAVSETSPERLAVLAPMWAELMLNENENPLRTDLPDNIQTNLTAIANRSKAGINPNDAAESLVETQRLYDRNPDEAKARQDEWGAIFTKKSKANRNRTLIDSLYEDLVGPNGPYDRAKYLPWGAPTPLPDPGELENKTRYKMWLHDGWMKTRNQEDAIAYANMRFKQSHHLTNINGDWEVQYMGVPGDNSDRRPKWLERNANEEFLFFEDERQKRGKATDLDALYYMNPTIVDGEHRYDVYYNGRPLLKEITTSDGMTRTVQVTDTITASDAISKMMDEIDKQANKEIAKLEKELRTHQRMQQAGDIYSKQGESGYVRRLPEIPNEIEFIREGARKRKRALIGRQEMPEM